MPPEVLLHKRLTRASDVYGYGILVRCWHGSIFSLRVSASGNVQLYAGAHLPARGLQ